ncbi:isoamylase early set domain-containing protein [Phototrophicus methaneseepsis]|uniref:Isoamylase early set domain-containing protein n=1 Tax=Phototrophicus methaneseepsis TaxID=2710758 RepID=A0A7S8EA01_9CHLR|nr:isoamylase early set domain-containing protein [Phototrophicus methaneseepsis]QPC83148.1 isoamylase early set domain-containing protein [Phototrophicus methaneseepsis]
MVVKEKAKDKIRATFTSPSINDCECLYLVGDFNEWDAQSHPMKQAEDGTWSLTISLDKGQVYQYRFYTDNGNWLNDNDADDYQPNPFGSDNSVVNT